MPLPTLAYRLIGRFSVSRLDQLVHPYLYRRGAGRGILGRILGCEMLLLTTVGRRSGHPRSVALFAFPVGEPLGSWAIIGSRGGSGDIPAWYRNLIERPDVAVQIHRQRFRARAREVFDGEYEAIFERAATAYPGYRLYRAEAAHHIPIVVLERVGRPVGPRADGPAAALADGEAPSLADGEAPALADGEAAAHADEPTVPPAS